jgi:predicted anti-sigma-YlaC factor YlaD
MDCDKAREAISARIDGEDPGVPGGALEAHLEECASCRGWQQRAHALTRRARLGGSFLDHDLTPRVMAAVPAAPTQAISRLSRVQRGGLVVAALAQLAITVPLLVLGHDHDAGTHAAHELGSFDLALAVAFAVGAIRPALSAGLAWPSAIAACGLIGTAVADLIGGQTVGADEAQHLIALAGAALLCWQARTVRGGSAAAAVSGRQAPAGVGRGAAGTAPVYLLEDPPKAPQGGDAARVSGPGISAGAAGRQPAGAQPDGAGAGEQRSTGQQRGTGEQRSGEQRSGGQQRGAGEQRSGEQRSGEQRGVGEQGGAGREAVA